jgi:membrane-associated phospholipid phosphatase
MLGGTVAAWSMAGLALGFGARLVCPDGACRVLDFDRRILVWLDALRQPALDAVMSAVTWLGSIVFLLPIALVLAWRRWHLGRHVDALLPAIAVTGTWLLSHAGKLLVARPRPDLFPTWVSPPADLSFPSAHTMQITAFALAWVLAPGRRPGWTHVVAAAAAILAVALSRLYLQVHFPSDVAIAIIAGAAWVIGLRLLPGVRG